MIDLNRHTCIALGYFLLVGLLGILLRLFFVTPIDVNYKYIVHAHSHVALLGWVYIGLITVIYRMYYVNCGKATTYRYIFWFTNLTILGMLVTFPFQGYALFSIIFSTLFLFASYLQAWFFFKYIPEKYKKRASYKCIKAALIYLIISSIGPWVLGGVMATMDSTSIWYKLAIYFYLHFQYNAWFILALCGAGIFLIENAGIGIRKSVFRNFFFFINAGIILSFLLSALWVEATLILNWLGGLGAVLQIAAFYFFLKLPGAGLRDLKTGVSPFTIVLLKISFSFLIIKMFLQLLTALPYFARLSTLYIDMVIGYLHLVFLGVVSIALFAFLFHFKLLKLQKFWFWVYFTGFIVSEILIFYRGAAYWLRLPLPSNYALLITLASALIPLSLFIILSKNLKADVRKD